MRVAKLIIGDINSLTGGYLYEKKLIEYLRVKGIQADVVSIPNIPYMLHFFSNFWLLFYFLIKKCDVIIEDGMTHPAVWLFNLWARHVKKTKVVAIVHMFRWIAVRDSWQMPFIKFIEKEMLMSTSLIIANSMHTKREAEKMGVPPEAIEMVYPGFDMHLLGGKKPSTRDETKLLFVGNWDPRKGLETLVEAVYRLNNPKIVLDIVGDDSFYPKHSRRVKSKVAVWNLEGRVRFHGRIDRESIGKFYSEADIFVLPSSYEPFGIVFAEAMSFGLPIIAASAGGIPELVEHEVNGLLVPPNDANALADAIDKLTSSAELREEMGRKSYEKSKELNTWDDCFDIVYGHLKRLVADDT